MPSSDSEDPGNAFLSEEGGWEVVDAAGSTHVLPLNDLIAHETGDCICGPDVEGYRRKDGWMSWTIFHHSLDGRELSEG